MHYIAVLIKGKENNLDIVVIYRLIFKHRNRQNAIRVVKNIKMWWNNVDTIQGVLLSLEVRENIFL